ncbi:MAG: TRAP transporter large permease [Rhodobacter sp.]|nr:TRAP transporter large permease [Paracoccaceae bacterium]MCC0076286.1 TRAP transporter large permease [Rhodobacter sp.]
MTIALTGFAVLLLLCFLGAPVGFATLLVGYVGYGLLRGFDASLTMVGQQVSHDAMNYGLSVIPLFVLMGVFIYRSDISSDLFSAANRRFGRLRGGLAYSTVLSCGGFAAVSGSTLATAATMTKVAMPSMRQHGYSDSIGSGTIAAGGTLGIMIPPSVPLVAYGLIAEQDVGQLFIAGILPGLLLMALFMLTIRVQLFFNPALAPEPSAGIEPAPTGGGTGVWPVVALFVLVLGGIYGGIFTATEASGIGATGAASIAMLRGRLRSLAEWRAALAETVVLTAKIFAVLFGALVFTQFVNLSGLPIAILRFVVSHQLSGMHVVLFVLLLALVMGMVFEAMGILVLLVPMFIPALFAAQVDMIWFGILVILVAEIGLLTPPIGMNVFVVKSVLPDVGLGAVFRGVMPYVGALFVALALILLLPPIATALPMLVR